MALLLGGSKKIAEMDGKVTCGEKCGLYFMGSIAGIMALVDFVTLLWGSIVVFSAWPVWTTDPANDALDEFCAKTPMLFAFITLVIRWILAPVFITLACLKQFYWKS